MELVEQREKEIEEYLQSWWVIPPCLGITDEVPVAKALRRVLFRLPKWAFDEVRNSIMVVFEDPRIIEWNLAIPPRQWSIGLIVMFHPAQEHSLTGLVGAVTHALAHVIAGRRENIRDGKKFDGRDLRVEWGFADELEILERENKKDYSKSDFGPPKSPDLPEPPGP